MASGPRRGRTTVDEDVLGLMRANLLAVFGERDPRARRAAAGRTYAPDVEFTDADGTVRGVEAVLEVAGALLDGVPAEFVFTEDSPLYVGPDHAALTWTFGPPGGEPAARGVDVATVAGGRITRLRVLLSR